MAEEPAKCRESFALAECERPLCHDGAHSAEMALPAGLGPFIDQAWERMIKARRSYRRWRGWFISLTVTQAIILTINILGGVHS